MHDISNQKIDYSKVCPQNFQPKHVHSTTDGLCNRIREIIKGVLSILGNSLLFPIRYFGGKNWSVLGLTWRLISGQVLRSQKSWFNACFDSNYKVKLQSLMQLEGREYLKHLACACYSYMGKNEWIEGILSVVDVSNFSCDLEIKDNFLFDRKLGLKLVLLESENNEVFIAFGAYDACAALLEDKKARKEAINAQSLAIAGNYVGITPEIFKKAYQVVEQLKGKLEGKGKKVVLVGQSFGGILAQYVGLKSRVQAVCFNSIPLGAGLQWDLGERALEDTDHVIHISAENDYVSDNRALAPVDYFVNTILGFKTPGNFGKRYSIPSAYADTFSIHTHIPGSMVHFLGHDVRSKIPAVINSYRA
ncbi:MAG: hypothetical protein P4L16_06155 [Chlamydiales bacterium]|nr:hypothetical protein [Chlamydiales bacterium]